MLAACVVSTFYIPGSFGTRDFFIVSLCPCLRYIIGLTFHQKGIVLAKEEGMNQEAEKIQRKQLRQMQEAQERLQEAQEELEEAQEEFEDAQDQLDEVHAQSHGITNEDNELTELLSEEPAEETSLMDQEADSALPIQSSESKSAPSLMASVEYVHGKKREVIPLDKLSGYKKDSSRLLWIGLKDPTTQELAKVSEDLGILDEAVQEVMKTHRKPMMVDYGDYIHMTAVTITKESKKLVFGEMQMLFGVGFVLTVRRGGAMSNTSLRDRLERCPELIARGSDFVVAEILDVYADSLSAVASRLETEVNQVEQKMMLRGFKETDIRKLYKQRRDLLRIHTCMAPMIEICRKLALINSSVIEKDSRSYFSIVSDRIARIDEQINSLREALAFAFEASLMIGQSHQTDITKKLAAWAAMLAVPTAIAGIYGMNFKWMPELEWDWGYPLVLALMLGICSVLFWRFKKADWL